MTRGIGKKRKIGASNDHVEAAKVNKSSQNGLTSKIYGCPTLKPANIFHQKRQKFLDEKLPFNYYVVLDFECTSWGVGERHLDESKKSIMEKENDGTKVLPKRKTQEIIKFSAVLVDSNNGVIVDTFQEYVKPKLYPKLSEYCTELTGITQHNVNNGKSFHQVLNLFLKWLKEHGLNDSTNYLIITDGSSDIRDFLNGSLVVNDLPFPHQLRTFADLKFLFRGLYPGKSAALLDMLKLYNIEFEGREHCGLDDAKNIAQLVKKMAQKTSLVPTHRMIPHDFVGDYKDAKEVKFSCDLERRAFAYIPIITKLYKEKLHLRCDDCKQGRCKAAKFYQL